MKAHQERMKALMDANLENMRACLGVTALSRKDRGHNKGQQRGDENRN
jgi:hypothetical protein